MDEKREKALGYGFSIRTLLEIIAVAAFILFLFAGPATENNAVGRYRMFRGPSNVGSDREATYLYDTQTGDCWMSTGEPWSLVDRQKPPAPIVNAD